MSNEKESSNFKGRGGKRPGAGRPLGSPNRLTRPLKEAAALHAADSLGALIHLRDNAESEAVRLNAAVEILNRGFGRCRPEADLHEPEGITVVIAPATPISPKPVTLVHGTGNGEDQE